MSPIAHHPTQMDGDRKRTSGKMNSKTTLPLLDAAAHDEVVDVLRRLTVAYPDNTPNEVACSVARCALEHAGVKVEAIDEIMAAVPKC